MDRSLEESKARIVWQHGSRFVYWGRVAAGRTLQSQAETEYEIKIARG